MVAGILAALYERERSGRGQAVETSCSRPPRRSPPTA